MQVFIAVPHDEPAGREAADHADAPHDAPAGADRRGQDVPGAGAADRGVGGGNRRTDERAPQPARRAAAGGRGVAFHAACDCAAGARLPQALSAGGA
ncbi:hypothetical protein G6F59_017709 [Rhizopus arrhizus]|nr:hypothetical protein G6F59_017709 [Rhizopus arrhizus]